VVDGGVVEVGEVGHIVALLVLGRVHLEQLVALERDRLAFSCHQRDVVAVLGGDLGALVALLLARHEEVLARVERLR